MLVIGVGGKPKPGTPPGFLGEGRKSEEGSPFEPKAPKSEELQAEPAACAHTSICPFFKAEEEETPKAEKGELEA
jgi:hypothetical protein